jgi:hypothetical protein
MRIRILREQRSFTPADNPRARVHLPKGLECTVRRAWGDQLVEAGDAEELDPPNRKAGED